MKPSRPPVAILVRVSTIKQETARQVSELQADADAKGFEVVEVCKATISGRADEWTETGWPVPFTWPALVR